MRDKVSGAIAIPKASWGCAPALPNRIRVVFLRQAAGNQKFFDPTIFQKCWRGVGEQPTFAEQIKLSNEMQQKSKRESQRIAIAFSIEMNVPNYEPQATKKFFDPTIFQKCWRGVGEQPTFAKQIIFVNRFSCCNCIF